MDIINALILSVTIATKRVIWPENVPKLVHVNSVMQLGIQHRIAGSIDLNTWMKFPSRDPQTRQSSHEYLSMKNKGLRMYISLFW